MNKITGKDLIKLGFIKVIVTPTESGEEHEFHYYVFEIDEVAILISCSNDEKIDDAYFVEFFDHDEIGKFFDLLQIKKLVEIINSAKK